MPDYNVKLSLDDSTDPDDFQVGTADLGISIRKTLAKDEDPNDELDKFRASLVHLLSKFKKFPLEIFIADQLHAWDIAIEKGFTLEEAREKIDDLRAEALELGFELEKQLQVVITDVLSSRGLPNNSVKIIHWNTFLKDPAFGKKLQECRDDNYPGSPYRRKVEHATGEFFSRHKKDGDKYDPNHPSIKISEELVLEESAVLLLMGDRDNAPDFVGYQGSLNNALKDRLKKIQNSKPTKMRLISISLTKVVPKTRKTFRGSVSDEIGGSSSTSRPFLPAKSTRKDHNENKTQIALNLLFQPAVEDLTEVLDHVHDLKVITSSLKKRFMTRLKDLFSLIFPNDQERFPTIDPGNSPTNEGVEDKKTQEIIFLKLEKIRSRIETNLSSVFPDILNFELMSQFKQLLSFYNKFTDLFSEVMGTPFKLSSSSPQLKPIPSTGSTGPELNLTDAASTTSSSDGRETPDGDVSLDDLTTEASGRPRRRSNPASF